MFMRLIAWVVFVVLQIVCLPLLVLGTLMVTYRQLVVSRRMGVSQTAIEVINGRWTMDWFGMRPDPASVRLAGVLPNTSLLGLQLVLCPLWVKYKLSGAYFAYPRLPPPGGAETMADLVVARTLYFDRILERILREVEQFVLLGAGYDARAYGPLVPEGVDCFELDQPGTQELKRSSLRDAGIEAPGVTFVPVDFSRDDAFEKLVASGYDPGRKTAFLWEGVTLYLGEDDVRKTLRGVREHSAPGSVVVADVYGERFVRLARGKAARKTLEYTDEGVAFGLDFGTDWEQTLRGFLDSEKLTLGERYFMGRTNPKGPFMVVAECISGSADRRQRVRAVTGIPVVFGGAGGEWPAQVAPATRLHSTVTVIVEQSPSMVRCSSSPTCTAKVCSPGGIRLSKMAEPSPKCTHGLDCGMISPAGRHSVSMPMW